MNSESNERAAFTAYVRQANQNQTDRAIIYAGDLRRPWKSVYGFPVTAAWLAAGYELLLICREDEISDLMTKLNELLNSPECLSRAYELLKNLEQQSAQKLVRLVARQERGITEDEIGGLLDEIDTLLARPVGQRVADRLEAYLSPDEPGQERTGLREMVARLRGLTAALEPIKTEGFQVRICDRQRQPLRPALAARRNDPIVLAGEITPASAGLFQPLQYHLTLWRYVVGRGDSGQFTGWN